MKLTEVEKLIGSIIDEAEKEAKQTFEEAEQKKERAHKKMLAAIERETKFILEHAHKAGEEQKKRMLAVYGLELRKEQLKVKRDALDEAYKNVLENLLNLDKEGYLSLIKKILLGTVTTGKESVLTGPDEKYIDAAFIKDINEELQKQGKTGALTLSSGKAPIQNGFILQEGGLAIDCSFAMLIKELREQTETQAAKLLFG